MTRTQRATSPRAILKDRSESKSGYDKSLRKEGAGPHNWGSVRDELTLEQDALADARLEGGLGDEVELVEETVTATPGDVNQATRPVVDGPSSSSSGAGGSVQGEEEERERAREVRARALKDSSELLLCFDVSSGAKRLSICVLFYP